MNIEEARKVLWLKNNHRPMGELFDEGFLNRSRLEWAAEKSYDPTIKQAAKVLLDALKHSAEPVVKPVEQSTIQTGGLPIGISLDKARTMPWPFSPNKGKAMGELLDANQIALKDLGYAIENAWDEKVRQAAIALSLVRLEQVVKEPAPSAGFVHVISGGRSYSERKQIQLTYLQGAFSGLIMGLAFALIIISNKDIFQSKTSSKTIGEILSTPTGIVASVVALGLIVLALWLSNYIPDRVLKVLDKKIEEYRRGEEGEEKVIQMIIQALDGNWRLFRNVVLPGRNQADLDLVLVGPPGVWVLEVKNYNGEYRNSGENWQYRRGKKWKSASSNPSRQVLNNAVRLGNFLKADDLKIFVNPVIIWANEESHLQVDNPTVSVWPFLRLPDELGNIWQGEKISKIEREKINEKLNKLCTQPKTV